MRLLKFSMLVNYLSVSRNTKRALFIINIGIFLSIFACSSAIISLFIENKVSKLEYEHAYYSKYKRYYQRNIKTIPETLGSLQHLETIERVNSDFRDFIDILGIGKEIITDSDSYTVQLQDLKEMTDDNFTFSEEDIDFEYLDEKAGIELKKLIKDMNLALDLFKKNSEKIKRDYREIIYESSYKDLKLEIYNKDERINYDKESELLFKITKNLSDQMHLYLYYFNKIIDSYDYEIEIINNDIISYSDYEKNLILFAFLLQLSVFIIIQFFEISSVNHNFRKRIKIIRKKLQ